ncbi:MAG: MgtC/SapB family protein [Nanoarchaeota archaeon]|nr:MgtC/SapB family protein [Nanoarchaeota archaeon]MBU1705074.1 MgtC/SapB family protein [Nanoarchaeota archaeon]
MALEILLPTSEQLIKLGVALMLGALIGWERQISHKPAGLRTHILVCVGSTLATIVSADYFLADPARVASGILTGIGFLGAGTIIASQGNVRGLTTAASLWVMAAVGLAIGVGYYVLAAIASILILIILFLVKVEKVDFIEKKK